MSKKMSAPNMALEDVRVDMSRSKKHSAPNAGTRGTSKLSQSNEFVYVNPAFVGSVHSVNERLPVQPPPTSVIREQYWACSRWPYTQRVLAAVVGILFGAVIGLVVTMVLTGSDAENVIGGIFRSSAPD